MPKNINTVNYLLRQTYLLRRTESLHDVLQSFDLFMLFVSRTPLLDDSLVLVEFKSPSAKNFRLASSMIKSNAKGPNSRKKGHKYQKRRKPPSSKRGETLKKDGIDIRSVKIFSDSNASGMNSAPLNSDTLPSLILKLSGSCF